jgi:aldehyde dehydrogenase (NAD+)
MVRFDLRPVSKFDYPDIGIGKPFMHALYVDVAGTASCLRYYAGWADKIQGDVIDTTPNKLIYTIREPVGVCGQIIP